MKIGQNHRKFDAEGYDQNGYNKDGFTRGNKFYKAIFDWNNGHFAGKGE